MLKLPTGNAICYSGYRHGESPDTGIYPGKDAIREDLHLLQKHWRILRLYDCSPHAERVLEVIREDGLDFQVMLGAYLAAEESNPNCPWGGLHSAAQLGMNRTANEAELRRLVKLAADYGDIVFSLAVGNESTVDWSDHLVPVSRMIEMVRWVKQRAAQPVTFCENYVPWQSKLRDLVPELDFISLHTYPVWEYKQIDEALDYTQQNYRSVAQLYPDRTIVITEAGWTTHSNGRGIDPGNANQHLQSVYYHALIEWSRAAGILVFVFEAFDEPWKGSPDPLEPEKHWGLFNVNRQPKQVLLSLYPQ